MSLENLKLIMGQNPVYCCAPVQTSLYGTEDQCLTAGSGGGYFFDMDVSAAPQKNRASSVRHRS